MRRRPIINVLLLALPLGAQPIGAAAPYNLAAVDSVAADPSTARGDRHPAAGSPIAQAARLAAGRQLFEQGLGEPAVEAEIDGMAIGAEQFPCVGCHGELGRGRAEGGLVAPPIDWRTLRARRQGFNPRPAYDRNDLARALTAGLDPAGRSLDAGMPRYRLNTAQVNALATYLEALSDSTSPGVDDTRVRLALITGGAERFAAIADAVRETALAAAEHENARGGAYGRRIELVPIRAAPDDTAETLAMRLADQALLAAVGTFTPGLSAPTRAALDAAGLPSLFPIAPQITDAADQVPLYAAVTRQATALTEQWRRDESPKAAVLDDGTATGEAAARAVLRTATGTAPAPTRIHVDPDEPDAAARALQQHRPAAVFAFIDARSLAALLQRLPPPLRIYGLADQIGPIANRGPQGVSAVLSNPRAAVADGLPPRESAGEIAYSARLAIHALAESLRWAGRRLTRADLLRAARETGDALYRMELVLSNPDTP